MDDNDNSQPFPMDIAYMREDLLVGCLLQPFHDDDVECGRRNRWSSSCCKSRHDADLSGDGNTGTQLRGGNSQTVRSPKKFNGAVKNFGRADAFPFPGGDVQSNDQNLLDIGYLENGDKSSGAQSFHKNSDVIILRKFPGTRVNFGLADSGFLGEDGVQGDTEELMDTDEGPEVAERSQGFLLCEEDSKHFIPPGDQESPRHVRGFPFMAEGFPNKGILLETGFKCIQDKGGDVQDSVEVMHFECEGRPDATGDTGKDYRSSTPSRISPTTTSHDKSPPPTHLTIQKAFNTPTLQTLPPTRSPCNCGTKK
ncbi:uncharacterized protein LOC144101141 [Amblyomma americanum]